MIRNQLTTNPLKVSVITLGCPMNQVDSEHIMGKLVSLGFEIVPEEKADVIVVNTCGFIEEAREESIETILTVADLKKKGCLKSLIVTGCLAERYRTEIERNLPEADAVIGLSEQDRIPLLCLELIDRQPIETTIYSRVVTGPPFTAYLKIAEGCNNRCSYCSIPMIRGAYKSLPFDEIIGEAEELASLGTRELIILAQDTTRYGDDLNDCKLTDVLCRLSDIEGIEWIRLLYTHPARFSDEVIEMMRDLPKILPYIDMPIQHISNKILDRMGRATPPGRIYSLINSLRERIEDVVLRTSLMVGFPGETDEDFRLLVEFVKRIRFERLGAFIFSPEEGTQAVQFKDKVPEEVAEERFETLMETQAQIAQEFHRSLIGREMDMIVDAVNPENGTVVGRTYMDAPDVDGTLTAIGSVEKDTAFCRVRITDADTYDLVGDIL